MTGILPIANYLIDHADCGITNLKLNKLAYYVYGANLVTNLEEEIDGSPEAWVYGPVFPTIYHAYKHYGADPIEETIEGGRIGNEHLVTICDRVLSHYSRMKDWQLVALTHKEGSPWSRTYNGERGKAIPDSLIRDYFKDEVLKAG